MKPKSEAKRISGKVDVSDWTFNDESLGELLERTIRERVAEALELAIAVPTAIWITTDGDQVGVEATLGLGGEDESKDPKWSQPLNQVLHNVIQQLNDEGDYNGLDRLVDVLASGIEQANEALAEIVDNHQ